MIRTERLKALMTQRGLSQSELARRVGVAQATIFKLTIGETYGTKHLHKIARELGTTPAYLTGETDDPNVDTPEVELSFEERHLIQSFAQLGRADRQALLRVVDSMAGQQPPPKPHTIHDRHQNYTPEPAGVR